MNIKNKKLVVFSDYDGTITEENVIIMVMKEFAPPEWKEIVGNILKKRTVTLHDGIKKLFSLLESSKKDKIAEFARAKVKLRDGFIDFARFCSEKEIELNIVSGGVDFLIDPIIEMNELDLKVYSSKLNFNSEKIEVKSNYLPKDCKLCGDCICCKIEIMETYDSDKYFKVVIGDGLTDLAACKVADLVFARGDLVNYLKEEGFTNYIPFEDFDSVKQHLLTFSNPPNPPYQRGACK